MEDENIIFEQYIGQQDDPSSLYIKLSSEEPTILAFVKPIGLYLGEAFSFASPMVSVTFDISDDYGTYASVSKLDPDTLYTLHIGNSKLESTVLPLKIAQVTNKNTNTGKTDQISFKVTFVHSGWNELINIRHNRAWVNKPYSDVVSDMITECGYSGIQVSPSRNKHNVIQPYWSNLMLLKWVQQRAISTKYQDHYEFGCKINGEFFFKTVSDIIEENRTKAVNGQIPFLKLGGYDIDDLNRQQSNVSNYNSPTYFTDYEANEFYMDSVINGAGGVQAMYYDIMSGTFVKNTKALSNSNSLQLSDWGSIKSRNEVSNMKLHGGRNSETVNEAINKVSSVSLSTNQFSIITESALNIHIGDLVETALPNQSLVNLNLAPFAVMYSGFYVVAGVHHFIPLIKSSGVVTKIDLARHGFDGKDLTGYVKTRLGKFVSGE